MPLVETLLNGGAAGRRSLVGRRPERMPRAARPRRAISHRRALAAPRSTGWARASSRTPPRASSFTPGRGLWAAIWFADEAAKARWQAPVEARFPPAGRFRLRRRALARLGPRRSAGIYRWLAAGSDPVARRLPIGAAGRAAERRKSFWTEPLEPFAGLLDAVAVHSRRRRRRSIGSAAPIVWSLAAAAWKARPAPATVKKLLNMVAEGSVLVAARRSARRGRRRRARRFPASRLSRRIRRGDSDSAGGGMRYRLTCLTPTLVGDGPKLAAIDYMVWKDHVNVLDQRRIFRLLAKGPRLEGYLTQLKKADKLDFASWGGFAQNFAGRRIPFEHPSCSAYWERASGESLNIPTFASGASGPYLPGAAIKGALRTGMLFANLKPGHAARRGADVPRRPPAAPSRRWPGVAGSGRRRTQPHARHRRGRFGAGEDLRHEDLPAARLDAASARPRTIMRSAGSRASAERSTARASDDSTPIFAEMATPGSVFEGAWEERNVRRPAAPRFSRPPTRTPRACSACKAIRRMGGSERLGGQVAELEAKLATLDRASACLVSIGWGGGLLSKTPWIDKENDSEQYRQILRNVPLYRRAIDSGLPFPKTRRIVFQENEPASLPGWALLRNCLTVFQSIKRLASPWVRRFAAPAQ